MDNVSIPDLYGNGSQILTDNVGLGLGPTPPGQKQGGLLPVGPGVGADGKPLMTPEEMTKKIDGIAQQVASLQKSVDQIGSRTTPLAVSAYLGGVLWVHTSAWRWVSPVGGIIEDVRALVLQAPGTQSILLDVHLNGTTVFTTQSQRPTIAAGQTSSTTLQPAVIYLNRGDVVTLDVDQVGSGPPGADLTFEMTIQTRRQSS